MTPALSIREKPIISDATNEYIPLESYPEAYRAGKL